MVLKLNVSPVNRVHTVPGLDSKDRVVLLLLVTFRRRLIPASMPIISFFVRQCAPLKPRVSSGCRVCAYSFGHDRGARDAHWNRVPKAKPCTGSACPSRVQSTRRPLVTAGIMGGINSARKPPWMSSQKCLSILLSQFIFLCSCRGVIDRDFAIVKRHPIALHSALSNMKWKEPLVADENDDELLVQRGGTGCMQGAGTAASRLAVTNRNISRMGPCVKPKMTAVTKFHLDNSSMRHTSSRKRKLKGNAALKAAAEGTARAYVCRSQPSRATSDSEGLCTLMMREAVALLFSASPQFATNEAGPLPSLVFVRTSRLGS